MAALRAGSGTPGGSRPRTEPDLFRPPPRRRRRVFWSAGTSLSLLAHGLFLYLCLTLPPVPLPAPSFGEAVEWTTLDVAPESETAVEAVPVAPPAPREAAGVPGPSFPDADSAFRPVQPRPALPQETPLSARPIVLPGPLDKPPPPVEPPPAPAPAPVLQAVPQPQPPAPELPPAPAPAPASPPAATRLTAPPAPAAPPAAKPVPGAAYPITSRPNFGVPGAPVATPQPGRQPASRLPLAASASDFDDWRLRVEARIAGKEREPPFNAMPPGRASRIRLTIDREGNILDAVVEAPSGRGGSVDAQALVLARAAAPLPPPPASVAGAVVVLSVAVDFRAAP